MVRTGFGGGDQLAGRPIGTFNTRCFEKQSGEQQVARPYRSVRIEGSALERGNPGYDGWMRIELITTGSELLLGQVLNSHPGYLSDRLS